MKVFIIVNDIPNQLSEIAFRYNPLIISIIRTITGSKFHVPYKKLYIPKVEINEFIDKLSKSNIEAITDMAITDTPDSYRRKPSPMRASLKRCHSPETPPPITENQSDTKNIFQKCVLIDGSLCIDLPLPFDMYCYLKDNLTGISWSNNKLTIREADQIEKFYKICSEKDYNFQSF